MASEDVAMFVGMTNRLGNLAGVFEYTDDTGYFYLYRPNASSGEGILGSIWITSLIRPDFTEADVEVVWDADEKMVGLRIKGVLYAVFDAGTSEQFGGSYDEKNRPQIPPAVLARF